MNKEMGGLLLENGGPIASITFNKPAKANAIDVDWIRQLKSFFEEVRSNREVRCVLIKSTGKHFSAGADMDFEAQFAAMQRNEKMGTQLDINLKWNEMTSALLAVPQPVVASVQGGVVGGAIGLVAVSDLVIAAESSFLFFAHVTVGVPLSELLSYFLPRQIGYKKSMQLALLGDRVSAREAEHLGLVNMVVPDDQLQVETDKLVERLANGPTLAYAHIKEQIMNSFEHSREEQAMLECMGAAKSALTRDVAEGIDAVIKRRRPMFRGL
jgi:2-(1,2-epoxy-1,2-dihydrophenyl)acetyl-CoA isomerase